MQYYYYRYYFVLKTFEMGIEVKLTAHTEWKYGRILSQLNPYNAELFLFKPQWRIQELTDGGCRFLQKTIHTTTGTYLL